MVTGWRRWASLNCASLNAALLASRLGDHRSVFALMLFAVELFAFFPISCHYAKQRGGERLHLTIAVALFAAAVSSLAAVSPAAAGVYVTMVVFVTLVCPAWMLSLYQFKEEIRGPWDVAHIDGR